MQELLKRLAALDPGAGEELRVVDHFDALIEERAGLEAFVRAAAVLAGCPTGVSDPSRHSNLRVLPDGRREDGGATGVTIPLRKDGPGCVWLERDPGEARATDLMVLERLAAGARVVLDRTRTTSPVDPALVELLVEPTVKQEDRRAAARRLGLLDCDSLYVIASPHTERSRLDLIGQVGPLDVQVESARVPERALPERAGVGMPGSLDRLPESFEEAALALRMTAAGTPSDPGPTRLFAADLGGLLVLARGCDARAATHEIDAIENLAAGHAWALATLDVVTTEVTLRGAAVVLHVHHSTLQARIEIAERSLGYSLHTQPGRTRLHVALSLRRLRNNQYLSWQ